MRDKLVLEGINSKGYGIIPKTVMQDQELHITAKAIYAYFKSYAGSGNSCFPTQEKMSLDLGISKDTLRKYIKHLEDGGYISVLPNKDKGKFTNNVYIIHEKSPCMKLTDTVSTVPDGLGTNNNNTLSLINNKSKKNKYLDFIYLTKEEYKKLNEIYPEEIIKTYMESLNDYIGSKGKKYKSHYYTIRSWLRRDGIRTKEELNQLMGQAFTEKVEEEVFKYNWLEEKEEE